MSRSSTPITIDLSTIEEGYLGFIHPRPSGIIWTNQVGGTYCGHPRIEGIFVPLPAVAPEQENDPLCDYYMPENSFEYREMVSLVREFLATDEFMSSWFEPLSEWHLVPDSHPRVVAEAWVPVRVRSSDSSYYGDLLKPFVGEIVVLTYPNSD